MRQVCSALATRKELKRPIRSDTRTDPGAERLNSVRCRSSQVYVDLDTKPPRERQKSDELENSESPDYRSDHASGQKGLPGESLRFLVGY